LYNLASAFIPARWKPMSSRHNALPGSFVLMQSPGNSGTQLTLFAPPISWQCPVGWYNSSDGCDCGCGAGDPDCVKTPAPAYGCYDGPFPFCTDNGGCDYNTTNVPVLWSCNPLWYGSGDGCDCNCTVWDPDCDAGGQVWGCPLTMASPRCLHPSTCMGAPFPTNWTCIPTYYNASDGCDCNCGIYDPDCDVPDAKMFGCGNGTNPYCNDQGQCLYSKVVPDGWWCDPKSYQDGLLCNCNCGVNDPDCSPGLPKQLPVSDCQCPFMTCVASMCVGSCDGYLLTSSTSLSAPQSSISTAQAVGATTGAMVIGCCVAVSVLWCIKRNRKEAIENGSPLHEQFLKSASPSLN